MENVSILTKGNLPFVPLRGIGGILLKHIETPIGTMVACATDKGICMLEFLDRKLLETTGDPPGLLARMIIALALGLL